MDKGDSKGMKIINNIALNEVNFVWQLIINDIFINCFHF